MESKIYFIHFFPTYIVLYIKSNIQRWWIKSNRVSDYQSYFFNVGREDSVSVCGKSIKGYKHAMKCPFCMQLIDTLQRVYFKKRKHEKSKPLEVLDLNQRRGELEGTECEETRREVVGLEQLESSKAEDWIIGFTRRYFTILLHFIFFMLIFVLWIVIMRPSATFVMRA